MIKSDTFLVAQEVKITRKDLSYLECKNQVESTEEILNALELKGYKYTLSYNYLSSVIINLDNIILSGYIIVTQKNDCDKWLKVKKPEYIKKYNLDCDQLGYIHGELPKIKNINKK